MDLPMAAERLAVCKEQLRMANEAAEAMAAEAVIKGQRIAELEAELAEARGEIGGLHEMIAAADADRDRLASRLAHHAHCEEHAEKEPDPSCPYCADRSAYARHLETGGTDYRPRSVGRSVPIEQILDTRGGEPSC